jgi:hypothetical protein
MRQVQISVDTAQTIKCLGCLTNPPDRARQGLESYLYLKVNGRSTVNAVKVLGVVPLARGGGRRQGPPARAL